MRKLRNEEAIFINKQWGDVLELMDEDLKNEVYKECFPEISKKAFLRLYRKKHESKYLHKFLFVS